MRGRRCGIRGLVASGRTRGRHAHSRAPRPPPPRPRTRPAAVCLPAGRQKRRHLHGTHGAQHQCRGEGALPYAWLFRGRPPLRLLCSACRRRGRHGEGARGPRWRPPCATDCSCCRLLSATGACRPFSLSAASPTGRFRPSLPDVEGRGRACLHSTFSRRERRRAKPRSTARTAPRRSSGGPRRPQRSARSR